jgi:hypothetical protein
VICQPAAMSGEQVASRAQGRSSYYSREPASTGSLGRWFTKKPVAKAHDEEDYADE